jgi:hypothetical protein
MLFQTASEKKAVDMRAQSTQEFRDNQHLSHSKLMGDPVNQQPPKHFHVKNLLTKTKDVIDQYIVRPSPSVIISLKLAPPGIIGSTCS